MTSTSSYQKILKAVRTTGLVWLIGCAPDIAEEQSQLGESIVVPEKANELDEMSAMGRIASQQREALEAEASLDPLGVALALSDSALQDEILLEASLPFPNRGGQAELSMAVDATGQHIVVGFNDTRGFQLNPVSVSGFAYSDDGGKTFVDGGQLPSPGNDLIGTTRFPRVQGDAEVKYIGDCTFIYTSIILKKFTATTSAQTMGFHRSTDCGHTWEGPFEIPSATNPNGLLNANGSPRDSADKEFVDVDPETGRVLMSWSNFTPVAPRGVEIKTTYTDNILDPIPTWSPGVVVAATLSDGQASLPRFAGDGSSNAYVTWRRTPGLRLNNVGFARSTNNGETWEPPVDLTQNFTTMDQVLGNDRVNNSPSMAVDNSGGCNQGDIYIVYANNNSLDGSDIAFQRSVDGGLTFSTPIFINSRIGGDRAQWFPWITVDSASGRIYVFYYDQGIAESGDLTETSYTYSDDGGDSWSPPVPLTNRPFRAGFGNDLGQPNLGDYNQGVAQNGSFFSVWAETRPVRFDDGQPTDASFTVPEIAFAEVSECDARRAPLSLGEVSAINVGVTGATAANLDPGDLVHLTLPLRNYVTNPLSDTKVSGIKAELTANTPGVRVLSKDLHYKKIEAGESGLNQKPGILLLAPDFVPGTDIELVLEIKSSKGKATLRHTLHTGTPLATTLFTQNFDAVAPGQLPAGWFPFHAGGANVVPWTTSSTFCGTGSNAAFHPNANDGLTPTNATRFERLFSPTIVVPADAQFVTVEFDVCYNTEEDPNFRVQAFDGFLLRITDFTPGRIARANLVEAFATEFTTGTSQHYPKHFPRSTNTAYFEDMSAWAGDSQGVRHVKMRLPGMEGSSFQLRWDYAQDASSDCSTLRPGAQCGVMIDNVVVQSVRSINPAQP
jgi:hypothetical protein